MIWKPDKGDKKKTKKRDGPKWPKGWYAPGDRIEDIEINPETVKVTAKEEAKDAEAMDDTGSDELLGTTEAGGSNSSSSSSSSSSGSVQLFSVGQQKELISAKNEMKGEVRDELTNALGAMLKTSLDAFSQSMNQGLDGRFAQITERMKAQDVRIAEIAAEKKSKSS